MIIINVYTHKGLIIIIILHNNTIIFIDREHVMCMETIRDFSLTRCMMTTVMFPSSTLSKEDNFHTA